MKRFISLLLALVLCLSGCLAVSPDDTLPPTDSSVVPSSEATELHVPTSEPPETQTEGTSATEPTESTPTEPTKPVATESTEPTKPTETSPIGTESPTEAPTEPTSPTTKPTEPTSPTTQPPAQDIDPDTYVANMSVEELVGQLFLARCPSDSTAVTDIQRYHLGGYILFDRDFKGQNPQSMKGIIASYQAASAVPMLIAVDEEGGTVTRVSCRTAFRSSNFPSPRKLYENGGLSLLLTTESEKSQLLHSLGINVNMAPVCDITTDPNAFMYSRSLGLDPATTGEAIAQVVKTMSRYRVGSVLKHFPGYGNNTDTHTGIAIDSRSLESLQQNDLVPFQRGIQAGCGAILVSHTIVECLDSKLPASLSPKVVAYLRNAMGFYGVIVTDDLAMQAITKQYGSGESAVMALEAGCDLLCTTYYAEQYQAVLAAVQSGRLSIAQLRASAARILRWKQALGLL